MARKKGKTGSRTNLYLDDDVKAQAIKLAFQENSSLSDLVEVGLRRLIARRAKKAA